MDDSLVPRFSSRWCPALVQVAPITLHSRAVAVQYKHLYPTPRWCTDLGSFVIVNLKLDFFEHLASM
jgi:hypothetical protein